MALSPPSSSSWHPLPLCPTPAIPEPPKPAPASTPVTSPSWRGTAPPAAVCSPWSDPLRLIQIARPRPRVSLRARAPNALACLSALPATVRPPGLIPSVRFRSHDPDHGYRFAHACPNALARLSAPKSSSAGPARSTRSPPLSLTLPGPLVSAPLLARAPLAADLISAVGFRSDG
jgi:hypothetical protein